jgi:L-seryl-tRNA(Ser) seleniumtransferase
VGATTNRTHARDYARAIGRRTALLLKIHRSNFRIDGFVAEATVEELAAIGAARAIPVVEDLGSGAVVDLAPAGVREPRLADSIASGAAIVTASGDKLLGGPQAGIVAGRGDLLRAMKANPLFRALRIDKLSLAALEATLRACYDPDGGRAANPTLAMLARTPADLERDARALAARIERGAGRRVSVAIIPAESEAGGGAQPVVPLPTVAVAVRAAALSAEALAERLRAHATPIVARIREDAVLLDPRTLLEGDADRIGAFFDGLGRGAPPEGS